MDAWREWINAAPAFDFWAVSGLAVTAVMWARFVYQAAHLTLGALVYALLAAFCIVLVPLVWLWAWASGDPLPFRQIIAAVWRGLTKKEIRE